MSKRRRRKQHSQLGPDGLPLPLKWRPRVRIFGLISGAIGGLGAVVLIQQYGIAPLGRALTLQGLIGGAIFGIVIPSVVFAIVVRKYNRKLAEARGRLPPGPAASPGVGAVVLFVMLIGTFTAFGTGAAYGEGRGPCRLVVDGYDVATLDVTPSDAIPVESESSFIASMSWPSDFATFEVRFFYAGFSYGFGDGEVDEEGSDGGPDSGTVELPVDVFFQYAGGLYEVHVDGVMVNGQSCNFAMLFDVDRNPLETVVGKVAAATAAVGAVGVIGVGAAAAIDGTRMIGDLTSILADPKLTTVFDTSGLDVNDGIVDGARVDRTGDGLVGDHPGDTSEPSGGAAPEPKVVPKTGEPGAGAALEPKVVPKAVESVADAAPEPGVIPKPIEPAGGAVEPKVAAGSVARDGLDPKVIPDAAEPALGSVPGQTEMPVEPIVGDGVPDEIATEPAGAGTSEPAALPSQLNSAETAADAPGPGGEPATGEVPPTDPIILEPAQPATGKPGGGVLGGKVGMAAGVVLTPALVGSLERAAKERSSGAASTTASFWFYVTEPTPLFGLEDYSTVVGELSPGSWYLAQGTHGEWVHAVDSATNVEGWVAGPAAQPAP